MDGSFDSSRLTILSDIRERIDADGFAILPGAQSHNDIDEALVDYDAWLAANPDLTAAHTDERGRPHRVTNLHLGSAAAMKLAKNPALMEVLDFLFGEEAAVYSSLTFRYSTMQSLHRDAPYFHTAPEGRFFGVWTAMEDVSPDAGPLSFIPGSHRITFDRSAMSLSEYEAEVTRQAVGPRTYALLKKGDVAIWHAQTIHGGSPSVRPELTRKSMVVHCAPASTAVHGVDAFLAGDCSGLPASYPVARADGRQHADFARPDFMSSI